MTADICIQVRGLSFRFSPQAAAVLSSVDLDFGNGELHLLLGENGAGKSTLARILGGEMGIQTGRIERLGNFQGPLLYLPQHLPAISNTNLADYLWLFFHKSRRNTWAGPGTRRRTLESLLRRDLGELYDPAILGEAVPMVSSNLLHLYSSILLLSREDAPLCILDEPTAVLSETEARTLYAAVRRRTQSGLSTMLITHRIEEASRWTGDFDRRVLTVLRQGMVSDRLQLEPGQSISLNRLHRAMFTSTESADDQDPVLPEPHVRLSQGNSAHSTTSREPLFSLHGLSASFSDLCPLEPLDLKLFPGQVLALTGIRDEGLEQLERILSGRSSRYRGSAAFRGAFISLRHMKELRARGIAFVPSERMSLGSAAALPGYENLGILLRDRFPSALGLMRGRLPRQQFRSEVLSHFAADNLELDLDAPVSGYSGGMLQRLIIARELDGPPPMIILANPGWGLDARHRLWLRNRILSVKKSGSAVLLLTTELREALDLGDELIILHEGKSIRPLPEKYHDHEYLEALFLGSGDQGTQTPDGSGCIEGATDE